MARIRQACCFAVRKTPPKYSILAGKRQYFRRLKTNSLSGFHKVPGLAQLSFNQVPSSLRSSLKTFGLPLESVLSHERQTCLCVICHLCHCLRKLTQSCILFEDLILQAHHTKSILFLRQFVYHSTNSLSHLCSQYKSAGKVSKRHIRSIQPICN